MYTKRITVFVTRGQELTSRHTERIPIEKAILEVAGKFANLKIKNRGESS